MHYDIAFSVIIPVFSEAGTINDSIALLRSLDTSGSVEIIVVDGDPGGSTINSIRDKTVIRILSPRGRAVQMNAGAAAASGRILVFLHADTRLPLDAFALIDSHLRNNNCVAGAFSLGINTDRKIFRITEAYVALRTRFTRIPFGDQAIFIRAEYFRIIGGYKQIPVMEDIEIMRRIKKLCGGIGIIPEQVLTSPRRWEQHGVIRCTVRNLWLQLLYILGVPPERLARFYPVSSGNNH